MTSFCRRLSGLSGLEHSNKDRHQYGFMKLSANLRSLVFKVCRLQSLFLTLSSYSHGSVSNRHGCEEAPLSLGAVQTPNVPSKRHQLPLPVHLHGDRMQSLRILLDVQICGQVALRQAAKAASGTNCPP